MSTISASTVNELRQRTGQPMMDCKKALLEANGDPEMAVEILRKKGKGVADKRLDKETGEGRLAAFIDPAKKVGALLELRCESAPVAKTEQFIQLANDLARQAALSGVEKADTLLTQKLLDDPSRAVKDRIEDVVGLIREKMTIGRIVRLDGLLGSYIHHDGSIGVLIQVEGDKAETQTLRDACMHIAALNPRYARREDVPADIVAKEKEIALAQISQDPKNANKPANIMEKIAEGKLKTWYAESVLLDQPFAKDPSKTVGDLLKSAGVKLVRFVRIKVGEAS